MSEYIRSIIVASCAAAALTSILPEDGEHGNRYVKYICAVVLLLVIAAPLRGISSFISSARDAVDAMSHLSGQMTVGSSEHGAVIDAAADNISRYITDTLAERYGFDRDGIRIRLVINDDDPDAVTIDEVQVYSSERSEEARRRAMEYLSESLMCDVRIFGP